MLRRNSHKILCGHAHYVHRLKTQNRSISPAKRFELTVPFLTMVLESGLGGLSKKVTAVRL